MLSVFSRGTLGAEARGGEDGRGWSRRELDLDALRRLDGRIELAAGTLFAQGAELGDAVLVADAKDGELRLERLEGEFLGGALAMTGAVAAGVPHRMRFAAVVSDGDMARLLRHFDAGEGVRGRFDANLEVEGAGFSQRDIVQSLAGAAAIELREGAVEGFDLAAVAAGLAEAPDGAALAARLDEAGRSGASAAAHGEATFRIGEGVARSDDARLRFEGAQGAFGMEIDLSRRWIDLAGTARLDGYGSLPSIAISLGGPLGAARQAIDMRELGKAALLARGEAAEVEVKVVEAAPEPAVEAGADTGGAAQASARRPDDSLAETRIDAAGLATVTEVAGDRKERSLYLLLDATAGTGEESGSGEEAATDEAFAAEGDAPAPFASVPAKPAPPGGAAAESEAAGETGGSSGALLDLLGGADASSAGN